MILQHKIATCKEAVDVSAFQVIPSRARILSAAVTIPSRARSVAARVTSRLHPAALLSLVIRLAP